MNDLAANMGQKRLEPPAWDQEAALAATGGDRDLARELLATLAQGLDQGLEHVTRSLKTMDWPALAETAHHLRGATGYCGVPALDGALRDLERAALAGDLEGIEQGAERVELEAKRLRKWMGL